MKVVGRIRATEFVRGSQHVSEEREEPSRKGERIRKTEEGEERERESEE